MSLIYVRKNEKEIKDTLLYPKIASPYTSDGTITLTETSNVNIGDIVSKIGCISTKTTGNIIAINTNIVFEENGKIFAFKNQIFANINSSNGDSGSISYIEKNKKAFGLLMA